LRLRHVAGSFGDRVIVRLGRAGERAEADAREDRLRSDGSDPGGDSAEQRNGGRTQAERGVEDPAASTAARAAAAADPAAADATVADRGDLRLELVDLCLGGGSVDVDLEVRVPLAGQRVQLRPGASRVEVDVNLDGSLRGRLERLVELGVEGGIGQVEIGVNISDLYGDRLLSRRLTSRSS
jgi:hypothetical protein